MVHDRHGYPALDKVEPRKPVRVRGEVRSIRIVPPAGAGALEATITDGHGTLTAVFLGRRKILGVSPGRRVFLEGVVTKDGTNQVMYNPAVRARVVSPGFFTDPLPAGQMASTFVFSVAGISKLFGLPAHPLFVHVPVVLIPLVGLGAIAMACSARCVTGTAGSSSQWRWSPGTQHAVREQ